jgi:hypothetical protein
LRVSARSFHSSLNSSPSKSQSSAGHGLVGCQPDAREPRGLVDRLQGAGELHRRAVRVGDDRVVIENVVVHAGDDERHAIGQPVGV